MEETREQDQDQGRIRGIDEDVGQVESGGIIAPEGAVQGKGGDGQRSVEQHPFFIRSVGPVIGDKYLRQVRQPNQGVVLDDCRVVEVKVVANGVGIDETREHKDREHERTMRSHLLSIEHNPA